MTKIPVGAAYAQEMDEADGLGRFRDEFVIAEPELLYMDGNSLGRLPKRTAALMRSVVEEQWGARLIRSWGEGWFEAPQRVGDKIAKLVGAGAGQVVAADSTSANLYKLVMAALALRPERAGIVTDALNFPSDVYILQGCARTLGGRHRLKVVEGSQEEIEERVLGAIDEDTALVTLSLVTFKGGSLYDAERITRRAHAQGALVLWDLSHAAGVVPVHLDAWEVDFAVGCTYKYLNGGPGAPAFLYVNRALQARAVSPIWGWFGEQRPFAFDLDYQPAEGIQRFQLGTPPVLSLLAAEAGVDLLLEAGVEGLREKSVAQTSYLMALFDDRLARLGYRLATPRDAKRRGSQVTLRHAEGYRINRALIEEMGVIPDFREPDHIRLGIAPIYTRYIDIWETVQRMARVVEEERYLKYPTERAAVT